MDLTFGLTIAALVVLLGNVAVALAKPTRLTPTSCPLNHERTHIDVPNVDHQDAGPCSG